MGKSKMNGMPKTPEKAVCGTLCLCLAVSVLSAVALIYLTVIIYLPAQRELRSGIGETSVMCTTIEHKKISDDIVACKWSSCSEWCLSKGGGACDHIYVSVRSNGTNIHLEECTDIVDKTCATLDTSSLNCKDDHQCTRLEKLFICEDGRCRNITSAYSCEWNKEEEEPPVNCEKKRNCVGLEGKYSCTGGWCSRIPHWKCERRCIDIPTPGKNVLLMAGDRMIMGNCRRAVDSSSGETVWSAENHIGRSLLASCTNLHSFLHENGMSEELVSATDCVNGTLLPQSAFEKLHNHSSLQKAFLSLGPYYKLDTLGMGWIPFEEDIMIFNKSRLMINHEGCVNTLMEECSEFYDKTMHDGRNDTARSRFPCHYAPSDPTFVVVRYNPMQTRWLFFIGFMVPASLLIVSCGVLFTCSRILNVDNAGRMNLNCCARSNNKKPKSNNTFEKEFKEKRKKTDGEVSPVAQIQLTTSGTLLGYNDDTEGDPL